MPVAEEVTQLLANQVAAKRILVVDNLSNWTDISSGVIGGLENVIVDAANSIYLAGDLLMQNHYDLVLTDLHMPENKII